jgi:hypothetical protein
MLKFRPSFYLLLVFSVFVCCRSKGSAQGIKMDKGSISGRVKDSTDLSNLPMATISVYKSKDTALVKYQLNDSYGRFKMDGLPIDSNLTLVVTYVGYLPFYKKFKLTNLEKDIIIPNILLIKSSTALKEVVVRLAPMVMRGDTLEFNADAFKTSKNAVIGDLIKTLPGFIVWGDGKITVNGKQVSKVLVEGKVFFTNDSRVSLNNIPKNAVDKIQVIPDKNMQDQLSGDTSIKTVSVNIGLKKGSKSGTFGKIGYGSGTDGRHEGDLLLAAFSPKAQLSIVGSTNNTNRNSLSPSDMMVASSYRYGLSKNLYQSNFERSGIVDQRSLGVIYNEDWNRHLKSKIQYNLSQTNDKIIESSNTSTLLKDSSLSRKSFNNNLNKQIRNSFDGFVEYRDSIFNIISLTTNISKSRYDFNTSDSVSNSSSNHFLNKTFGSSNGSRNENNLSLGLAYQHRGDELKMKARSKEDFDLKYQLDNSNSTSDRFRINSFVSGSAVATAVNRRYDNEQNDYTHYINTEYKNMATFLGISAPGTEMEFQTELKYNKSHLNADIHDYNASTSTYDLKNNYLSNYNELGTVAFRPALKFRKNFLNSLAGRYINNIAFSFLVREQYISQNNTSDKDFRNITRSYSRFIPAASLYYTKRIVGQNKFQFGISYTTESGIPTIDQLAPLVDSTQQYQYYFGNRKLRDFYNNNLELSYNWVQEIKNGLNFRISLKEGTTKNYISDSSYYNHDGIRISFPVNVNGYKYSGGSLRLTKPFMINKNLFTYVFSTDVLQSYTPIFINGEKTRSISSSINSSSELGYTSSNLVAFYFISWLNINTSRSENNPQSFKSTNFGSGINISLECPKRFHFSSSTNFNFNKYDYLASSNLVIWNAAVSYRLSKKEQFEIKFSANDILNQSAGIRNYVENNSIVFQKSNNLQQYFLLGVSYFPRFFGKGR